VEGCLDVGWTDPFANSEHSNESSSANKCKLLNLRDSQGILSHNEQNNEQSSAKQGRLRSLEGFAEGCCTESNNQGTIKNKLCYQGSEQTPATMKT